MIKNVTSPIKWTTDLNVGNGTGFSTPFFKLNALRRTRSLLITCRTTVFEYDWIRYLGVNIEIKKTWTQAWATRQKLQQDHFPRTCGVIVIIKPLLCYTRNNDRYSNGICTFVLFFFLCNMCLLSIPYTAEIKFWSNKEEAKCDLRFEPQEASPGSDLLDISTDNFLGCFSHH